MTGRVNLFFWEAGGKSEQSEQIWTSRCGKGSLLQERPGSAKSQLMPLARQTAAAVCASHCLPPCIDAQSKEGFLSAIQASQC